MEYENLKNTFVSLGGLLKELKSQNGNRLYFLTVKDEYFILILLLICFQKKDEKKFNLNDCILIKNDEEKFLYTKAIVTGEEVISGEIFIKYKRQNFKKEKRNGVVEILKPVNYMLHNAVIIGFADKSVWLNSRIRSEEEIVDIYEIDFPSIIGSSILKNINILKEKLDYYPEFIEICKFIEKINKSEHLNIFKNKEVDQSLLSVYINRIPENIKSSKVVIFSAFHYSFDENIFLLNEFIESNNLRFNEHESKLYSNNMLSIKVYDFK